MENITLTLIDWKIGSARNLCLGHAGEHNARRLIITTDAPTDYTFKLEVEHDGCDRYERKRNILDLPRDGDRLQTLLPASLLPVAGEYRLQLRGMGADGEVRKSDVFFAQVLPAINASETMPETLPRLSASSTTSMTRLPAIRTRTHLTA